MRPRLTTVAAMCGAAFPVVCAGLHAQSPVTRTLQRMEERAADNVTDAAEDMPEALYGFKPTPAQMSFGEVVLHVAGSNMLLCSSLKGTTIPDRHELSATDPKDLLLHRLKRSFDLCNAALEHADDSNLEDSIPFFDGRIVPRAAVMIELAVGWADHYGQLASYMRLNGLLPPTAKKKEA